MNKKILKIFLAIVPVILVMTFISVTPALAGVVSPTGCTADRSGVDIAKSTALASVGQTITFTVSASNPTSTDGCDIINRVITLTLPDGSTHSFGPSNYPNPTPVTFVGSVDYVAKKADLVGGSWVTTVSWTGTQLDGADSVSTGSKGVFVTYIPENLGVVKTATPAIQQTYTWTIDKSVTPATWKLFDGDTGTSQYTITVVKTLSGAVDTVSGTITITNPSEFVSAHVTGVTDVISPAVGATVDCGGFPFDIAPLGQKVCTYTATLPDSTTQTNTANVATTGDIGGGSGTAPVDFSEVTPTVIGGSINVDDTNGGSWPFSATGSVKYNKTFDCSGLEYVDNHASYSHFNTATIRGTELHHDATVNVDCYKLSVAKTAVGTFVRTYTWNILKSGPSSLTLDIGQTSSAAYTVTVTKSVGTDSNFNVTGTITVHNPATINATINSVTDAISGVGAATVNCSVTFPYTLAAGQDLVCTYSAVLPDTTSRTNNATATQQNYNYDKNKVATADGTKNYSGTAPVTFGDPTSLKDNCINVSDTLGGTLGTTCANKVFSYSKTVGPFAVCGPQTSINNTASFITSDTHTTGSSSWMVDVNVPCPVFMTGVWEVKKDIQICNSGTSTPQGPNYEIGGCVDLKPDEGRDPTYGNQMYVRSGSYLFTGEQLEYLAVARDLNGAQFLMPQAMLQIDGVDKVLCTEVNAADAMKMKAGTLFWYGHNVSSLLHQLPPQIGLADGTGFNSTFDKIYTCTYTVTSQDVGSASKVSVQVSDTAGNLATTLEETWAFNPAISASVTFDSADQSLQFPNAQPGTTVYSTNSLLIKNTALGGVDLAVFLTGNNLEDIGHAGALCPTTNVLSINNIGYRCNVGSYFSEQWTPIPNVKQSAACGDTGVLPEVVSSATTSFVSTATTDLSVTRTIATKPQCLVDAGWQYSNILIPDPGAHVSDSILHSNSQAQCTFQLNVPFPCMGTFSATDALDVLIRAV